MSFEPEIKIYEDQTINPKGSKNSWPTYAVKFADWIGCCESHICPD